MKLLLIGLCALIGLLYSWQAYGKCVDLEARVCELEEDYVRRLGFDAPATSGASEAR